MAKGFIASAVGLNADLQEHLTCVIHRGLLDHPMMLPCKGKHRLCQECTRELIGSSRNIACPECRESYIVPQDWATVWFDRVLHHITSKLSSNETEINQKVIKFVQESYFRHGSSNQRLHIKSVQMVSNLRLKANFDKCKQTIKSHEITTLLHGTTRRSALFISGQGFRIPESFERNDENGKEGELKFGKAIYFANAKKATEYGKNILVLADCILGRIEEKHVSELKLTPSIIHQRGYDTIHYNDYEKGIDNQEWAVYRADQCYPLCIIEYEFLDINNSSEDVLLNSIKKMSPMFPNSNVIRQALTGTENQCKEALRFIGDAAKNNSLSVSTVTSWLRTSLSKDQVGTLLKHPNETVRILFLRALWQIGQRDRSPELYVHLIFHWKLLIESLQSGYTDVSWRACGVLTNMAAVITHVRKALISSEVLNQLMLLLKRAVQFEDKTCVLTVLHLMANIAASEHEIMKQQKNILDYVNQNLLDHNDIEIQEAGNRLFCNIIGKGILSADWKRGGYKDVAVAPTID
ncbi:unnamed protein product [Adineta steineri]|uniref:PARP catalytic domain-containing protein n=1 Tax=Adineta steineri TaxID=433720 RepID=A0A815T5G6_9BILA|nr:unnamed protein product [Adineta steineri]CAF1643776.1 unnamed protein product [Adineta steineri]